MFVIYILFGFFLGFFVNALVLNLSVFKGNQKNISLRLEEINLQMLKLQEMIRNHD